MQRIMERRHLEFPCIDECLHLQKVFGPFGGTPYVDIRYGKNQDQCTRQAGEKDCRSKDLQEERWDSSEGTPSFNPELRQRHVVIMFT